MFEFFYAQKVFLTHKFYKIFTHSPALSRALCQNFSRMGSFLFYRLKSEFNGFVREIFLKNLIFSKFSRTKWVFHGHFLWFFHGRVRIFTQGKPIFFTHVCHFFTYKKKTLVLGYTKLLSRGLENQKVGPHPPPTIHHPPSK